MYRCKVLSRPMTVRARTARGVYGAIEANRPLSALPAVRSRPCPASTCAGSHASGHSPLPSSLTSLDCALRLTRRPGLFASAFGPQNAVSLSTRHTAPWCLGVMCWLASPAWFHSASSSHCTDVAIACLTSGISCHTGNEKKVCGSVRWMRSSPATPSRRMRVLKSTESSRSGSKPPTCMCVGGRRRRASSGASAGESRGSPNRACSAPPSYALAHAASNGCGGREGSESE